MHVWPGDGCENRKWKGGVALPIDFLRKIEISKFMVCLGLTKHCKMLEYKCMILFGLSMNLMNTV